MKKDVQFALRILKSGKWSNSCHPAPTNTTLAASTSGFKVKKDVQFAMKRWSELTTELAICFSHSVQITLADKKLKPALLKIK